MEPGSDEYYRAQAVPHLVHSDTSKPHRCPCCWSVAHEGLDETGGQFRHWHRYTCLHCGQQFAKRPWLRWHKRGTTGMVASRCAGG